MTSYKQQPLFFELPQSKSSMRGTQIKTERLPTNTTTSKHPIHRWFNFIAGFSPEFVDLTCENVLNYQTTTPTLLDPFAGCGTAPLAAVMRGIAAIGYEAHPVFERICNAKLPGSDAINQIDYIEEVISAGLCDYSSFDNLNGPSLEFLSKLFPDGTLTPLLRARQALERRGMDNDPLSFLVLSKMLDLSSHSCTDGVYKAPSTKKKSLSPTDALSEICSMIRDDLQVIGNQDISRQSQIYGKSSESMSEIKDSTVSIVVTSPPYLNNFDYAEMTRMHIHFWGLANTWAEITARVRSRLIVNTTTALNGHRHTQRIYKEETPKRLQNTLEYLVNVLAERRTLKPGKKDYYLLIYPYFAQMTRVLRECHRVMKEGASIHIMVADAAFYGIHISTPQLLTCILEDIGFKQATCELVRKRGHRWILEKREGSKTGLGEYHIKATR